MGLKEKITIGIACYAMGMGTIGIIDHLETRSYEQRRAIFRAVKDQKNLMVEGYQEYLELIGMLPVEERDSYIEPMSKIYKYTLEGDDIIDSFDKLDGEQDGFIDFSKIELDDMRELGKKMNDIFDGYIQQQKIIIGEVKKSYEESKKELLL